MGAQRAVMSWSGGKDSAYALWNVLRDRAFSVEFLLTTVSMPFDRISMHGVRRVLLEAQADSIGIPLYVVEVSEKTNDEYETKMLAAFSDLKTKGITHVIFGDIFLEDLKLYRDKLLTKAGLEGIYPLWRQNTLQLADDFIANGFKTITCCISDEKLDPNWSGKEFNHDFISGLPVSVDPCGENGEFHTFCYDGPIFRKKIQIKKGECVYRPLDLKTSDATSSPKGFWFTDLLLH